MGHRVSLPDVNPDFDLSIDLAPNLNLNPAFQPMAPTLSVPPAEHALPPVATVAVVPTTIPDFVSVERAFQQHLLWQQSEAIGRIETARQDVASAFQDAVPAGGTSLMLGVILFLTAYCLRPVPCIVLPGRGAFGIPAKRKRKG